MFYRNIYSKSWKTIKELPSLLFFGLFASILGFHEIRIIFNINESSPDFLGSTINSWLNIFYTLSFAETSWSSLPYILSILGIFILFALVTVLAVSSQGALTLAAYQDKTKGKKLNFLKNFQVGIEKFWPLLGLNILNTIIGYFFIFFVVEPLIYFTAFTANWGVYILMAFIIFFLLIPLSIIISFIIRYGVAYVVIGDQKFLRAFANSWTLFKINWLVTLENALLLILVAGGYYLAVLTIMVFLFTPFFILSVFVSAIPLMFWILISIGALLGLLVFLIGSAWYGAYYNLIWANLYLELTKGKAPSKVHRLAHRHLPELTR